MALVEAAFVLGTAGLVLYALLRVVLRTQDTRKPIGAGRWLVVHYDLKGETLVVLQKTPHERSGVLDEHLVAAIATDDVDYDAKFLAAMATARERRALFEAEEE
jgi:hypothetical protein